MPYTPNTDDPTITVQLLDTAKLRAGFIRAAHASERSDLRLAARLIDAALASATPAAQRAGR